MAGMTYERDQEVIAFHRHVIAGPQVEIESVATIPGSQSDEVWLVVKRFFGAGQKRYIERLSIGSTPSSNLNAATHLDSFLRYSGAPTSTLSGLGHLEGRSVLVWGDGAKQGPFTVSGGSITLTTPVSTACVGLAFSSSLETLSPEAAASGGTAQTRLGRISEVFPRVVHSMNGSVGPSNGVLETMDYAESEDIFGNYGDPTVRFTGDVRVPIDMEWGRQKRLRLVHSDPSPFHVLGLITEIRVSG
jgi:hypothetical protein